MQEAQEPYFIGIDIGTSSAKAVAFSGRGQAMAEKTESYSLERPEADAAVQDPDLICRAVLACVQKLVRQMPCTPQALGLSSAMHSVVAVNEEGKALSPLITWADGRARRQAEALRGTDLGTTIYRRSGTPLHAMSPLCKLAWLKEDHPALFREAFRFVGIKEYLLFQVFGEWVVDHSIASATGLFDLEKKTWIPEALEYAGLEAKRLSKPVGVRYQLSGFSTETAIALGIETDKPWIVGGSDGCLANLGAGNLPEDAAVLTIGTSGAVRSTITHPIQDPEERLFCYILDEQRYVIGGPTNNGGVVWEWFCKQFYPGTNMTEVFSEVEQIPVGSNGLRFLPYLYGERAPVWDAGACGHFWGIRAGHSRAHFARAVLEGICLNLFQITQALVTLGGPIKLIYADGGFTQSPVWIQLLADILGIPLLVSSNPHASAKGAAMLAMEATGFTLEEERDTANTTTYHPRAIHHRKYLEVFEQFKDIYPAVRSMRQ